MSAGVAVALDQARRSADILAQLLSPGCERIEIAGSIRRGKAQVHDIELVAVAKLEDRPDGMFGSSTIDLLEERVGRLIAAGNLAPRLVENHRADGRVDLQHKLGSAFKALVTPRGIPVDLFIVRPPATWGAIFALRTGPGAWNTRLVMECKSIGRRVAGGQVERWHGALSEWVPVPTPEEADFFAALGQPWVEPADRHVDRVYIDRAIADAVSS
jgi:DNA polymerase/3'-5' exonuclease PolX